MSGSALFASVGSLAIAIVPIALAIAGFAALITALGSLTVSGRPLGPAATRPWHHLAGRRAIWRARAWDEARSVDAFLAVARDLEHLGAPDELVARALRAADDEARHARIASERAGGCELPPPVPPPAPLSREEFLRRTFTEGCLGEALAAQVLAEEGEDEIARDEAEHAQLAWDILAWGGPVAVPVPLFALCPSPSVGVWRQAVLHRRLTRAARARVSALEGQRSAPCASSASTRTGSGTMPNRASGASTSSRTA